MDSTPQKPAGQADSQPINSSTDVRKAALAALAAGLSVWPPREDGTKAPDGSWKRGQGRLPTEAEIFGWYGREDPPKRSGLGTICGRVSTNLEFFEFDRQGHCYAPFCEAAKALGLGALIDRLNSGYREGSPSGGVHWGYRCEMISGSTKLAQYESDEIDDNGKRIIKPLIETKGEGGFIILAPSHGSVHPNGLPYVLQAGSFETIPWVSPEERAELFALARTFDLLPVPEETAGKHCRPDNGRLTPWDDFNNRADWMKDVLVNWEHVYTRGNVVYIRRPSKDRGVSATIGYAGKDLLRNFSTSTSLPTNKSLDKVAAYAWLNHGGDFGATARDLYRRDYGNRHPSGKPANPSPSGNGRHSASGQTAPEREGPIDWSSLSYEDLGLIRADSVEPEKVEWIRENRLARGKIDLAAGDGGEGKSQLALADAAVITTGIRWLDGSGPAPIGDVLILAAEDGARDTIIPRLMAAGADRSRVHIHTAKYTIHDKNGKPHIHPLSFQDLDCWRATFAHIPNLLLLIADPVPAFIGRGINDHRNADVRAVMEPFADLLKETKVAMRAITHLSKAIDQRTPTQRILGSVAYPNLARSVTVSVRDPEDKTRRLLCQVKNSLGPIQPALAYRIEEHIVTYKDQDIKTARVVFEQTAVDADVAESMLNTRQTQKRRGPEPVKTEKLAVWLFDYLVKEPGAVPLGAIFDAAGAAGLIGKQKDDGKWTGGTSLYRACDLIPTLPDPRGGKRIDDYKVALKTGGREITHWRLVNAESAF